MLKVVCDDEMVCHVCDVGRDECDVVCDGCGVIQEVRLTDAADRLAGTYSGGMRRRLSVAIALIGASRS